MLSTISNYLFTFTGDRVDNNILYVSISDLSKPTYFLNAIDHFSLRSDNDDWDHQMILYEDTCPASAFGLKGLEPTKIQHIYGQLWYCGYNFNYIPQAYTGIIGVNVEFISDDIMNIYWWITLNGMCHQFNLAEALFNDTGDPFGLSVHVYAVWEF